MQPQTLLEDIAATAGDTESLQEFVRSLKATGLDERLGTEGPFTVFAPDNDAFMDIPADTRLNLLREKNQLRDILYYHIISGRYSLDDLARTDALETLLGQRVPVSSQSGAIRLRRAHIVRPGIECSNGIIHVIDAVLIPRP